MPLNRHFFDYWVVVTSPFDLETKRLCEYHKVDVIEFDFGDTFNKGEAINAGIERLNQVHREQGVKGQWLLHLDADIVLPPLTRELLNQAHLDPAMLYGIDRHNITGAKAWRKHLMHPKLQHENSVYVHAQQYPVATRFIVPNRGGYIPIGFFQLWCPAASRVIRYPDQHTSAGRTDLLFAENWPRSKRAMLPEIIGYHLESEKAPQGANWNGRTTVRFDVRPHRCRPFHWWWWKRRHHRHHHHPPYWALDNAE